MGNQVITLGERNKIASEIYGYKDYYDAVVCLYLMEKWSSNQISTEFWVCPQAVWYALKKMQVKMRKPGRRKSITRR